MLRNATLALVLTFAAPATALACGMYIPPEKERLLAEVLDEIDAQGTAPAVTEVVAVPVEPVLTEVPEPVTAPSETHRAAVEPHT